ncbi:MAG: sugar-binding protein [Ferruginibacter sp.]
MNERFVLTTSYCPSHVNTASRLCNGIVIPFSFCKRLKKAVILLLISCIFLTSRSSAQFCETWALAASAAQTGNTGAATSGNTELVGPGMSSPTYGTYQTFTKPGGVNWPSIVNTADGIYLEFPVTPTVGNNLVITSITFSAYINNGSGSQLIANLYNGTTSTGVTASITSTSAGTPTNVSMTGLSIAVPNGTSQAVRFYITGNNSRTLNIRDVVICGTSTAAFCADATLTPNATLAAGSMGAGTTGNILTNFSVGASTNLTLTDFNFPFTASGLVAGDISNYKFYYTPTNTFSSPVLLSTVTTGLATSPIHFGPFSQTINTGTAGYFWVTTDVAAGGVAGHSITAAALTPANLTFAGTPTTCGTAPAQGTKTITILTVPVITTTAPTGITSTTATTGGNVTNDGGSPIIQRGLIYSTSPITDTNSITGGGRIIDGVNGTGSFTTSLTGLLPGTTYYVMSYAVNAAGVSYGIQQTLTTPPTPPRNCNGAGPLNGSAAKEGTFYLYGYVKAGERIDWNVIRTDDNSAGNWTINVYTPTGLYSSCTIGNTIGNQCTTAQITVTAATEGIWTLQAIPAGDDGNDVVCPALTVYNAGGTVKPGRVWTESLHGHDASTGVEPDFTLYFLSPGGYQYSATYSGLNGLNYTIVSDSLGVRTAPGSCESAYQSVSYTGANPLLGPDNANCGKKNKIFFEDFADDMPINAPRFNIAAGSGQITEPLLSTPVIPTLSNPVFTRTSPCQAIGNIVFNVTNFTGTGVVAIDVNNNGVFNDPEDRVDTLNFINGTNTIPFNGVDGLGNPIPVWQPMNIKVLIDKIGETHFVQSDIEIFGGLTVTRLNGPGAPDNTLYWNDSNLPPAGNCSSTSLIDGTGGVNSSGGSVHEWTQCGTCSPPRATCGSTNNGTQDQGSWGNQRLIDNWTYITDSTLTHTLFVAPVVDTTTAIVCNTDLPYSWSGNTYNASGIYNDTTMGTSGCDSVSTLVLSVINCNTYCEASMIVDAPSAISIDGNIEAAWDKSLPKPIQKATIGTMTADFLGTQWRSMYDATNLYILVEVSDPNYQMDGPNWWDDDAVEIFIDGNNSKGGTYDGDDFQFAVGRNGVEFGGTNIGGRLANINTAVTSTAGGYVVEIAIPWSQIGGAPTEGRMIGIDVQVDDDDDGGIRNKQVSWNTNNNQAFTNPSLFGEAPLTTCTPAPLSLVHAKTDPTCTGFSNGSINATGVGGKPPYSYTMTGPGGPYGPSSSGYFTGLAPGNYIVTVTDAVPNNVTSSVITITNFTSTLVVSNDTSICQGSAVQLSASGGTGGYIWSPATGLNNPNIANPVATPTTTTTYTVTSQSVNNLITNPGFELGNIGFTSDYVHYSSQTISRQTYTVANSPQALDQYFTNCPDHTTGSGQMLVVDGSDATNGADYTFWQQSIPVNVGSTYTFSYWIQTASADPSYAQVQTKINGSAIGTGNSPATTVCGNWTQVTHTWTANSPTAVISMYDLNTAGLGNDFTIDDMVFSTPCVINDSVRITVDTIVRSTTNITVCANILPYTWNLNDYNTAGTYYDTLTSLVTGCDSIARLNLTVTPVTTTTVNITACNNELPFNWNGNDYSVAGTYNDTLTSVITSCDSIVILNLSINNTSTSITNMSVCTAALPYTWNGTPYNTAGSYVYHTLNAAGCDSAATLNLTILNETTSITNISVCAATLPYTWNGTPYNTGGSYVYHTLNAAGCDSAATLNLTILNETTSITNISVCAATLPYTWNGTPYNTAGSYVYHTLNAAGCDSAATLNLTILNETTSVTNISVCAATLPYTWNGTPYNTAGSYVYHTLNAAGCDSAATLNLTILNETTSTTNISVCAATLPYTWNGTPYNTAGSYVYHTLNAAGCDSAATLNLTILNETTSITNISVCAATLPYTWNGTPYNTAGSYVYHTLNAAGCDSAATLNLAILNETTSTTNISVCAATLPYTWNGTPYNTAGSYVYHTLNAAGCDSAATLNLTILNETTSVTNTSVCAATLPYTWNGTPYNTGGSYVYHTLNAAGCDSAATLNLTILNETTSTTNTSVCAATLPYNWNGTPYNTAGSYVYHTLNAAGCDSAATLNLTILNETTSTTNTSVCAATLPYNWNGTPYNTAGSYVYHTLNAAGCDSAATLNLTILNETTSITNISVCAATLPYTWNGTPYNTAGSYVYHTLNAAGCDSAATLNLTILNETTSITNISVCAATLPYTWNGTPYNTAGSYVYHTLNAAGCDSAATLNLTILNETTSITNISVCAATLPYTWNGTPYNTAGSYVYHTLNAAGCDSAATLNLTILNETTSITNISVCAATLPYTWNGTPYNTAGSYVYHTLNAAGCDSAATLNLTILNETTSTTNISVCAATLPYTWNGTPYNTTGSYVYHTLNAAGCDSAATLNLTILNETTSVTNISVCAATLPYTWNGTPYNTGGSYVYHTLNAAGCDSAATLNLTILNETTSITNISVCAATLPYKWNGAPYNTTGSYVYHTLNAAGCDSAATLNLTILNETTSTTNISVCAATLPYSWNGTPYNTAGSYVYHTLNAAGCDSAATLNLTILNETTSITNISVCAATLPYSWNGTPYNTAGSYVYHTLNIAGCDSAATLNLTILNETTSTTNISVCAATLPYTWNGTPYNTVGSYVYHTLNAAGCDSAATLNLTILNETTSITNISVCAATLPYTWNGTPYNTAGSYVYHTLNAAGCDSAATLNLTILNETTSTTNISMCAATLPYTWNGTPYNTAGSYVYHTLNAAGCDSAATLNLTILNETTSTTNISVCAATLPYTWNGTPYNTTGSYVYHTLNAAGCDSAATLNLTILNETTSITNISVCAATLPYTWNGTPYNTAGSYVYHTLNAAGCDSAATLNLTILNETTSITNISVCAATLPYTWNGTPYNTAGSYVYHTLNAAGCDSAATLNLTILNETTSTTNISVCAATLPYTWNGTPYNTAGSYVYHTLNAAGCDSAATLNLTILNETTSITNISVCAATLPYTWNGTPYNTAGSYVYHTLNAAGCDSAATLNLTILNETTSITNISVCAATLPYTWNGTPYNTAGSYVYHTLNIAGCDSAATLNLTILNETTSTTNISVCAATLPYTWNGTPYNTVGSYVYHTLNAAGCDSAATLNLTILNETTSITNISVCAATLPYTWNGTPYNTAGSYVYHTLNAAGCDSAATLNLTILNETTSTTNISMCAATLPYTWNGTPYNTAGSYVYHTLNAAGCDSAATLNLTILNETTSTTNISVCAATLPYNWNGTPYNTAGSYVYHTLNAAGCDSAATLNLTILNETTSTTNISICAATLPYTWNGTPYNTAGSYVYHTLNAAGCDSAATLNLTILNETTSTTNTSVCAATLPYTWNGTPYNTAGSYVYHTLNAAGCDSAATLNLTILNETTSITNISVCAATLPYTWNGTPYNTAGSYVYHTLNAAGCDSAATLNLTILNETTSTTNISTCAATLPYTWNGTPYNTAGSYVYHSLNAAGCDSAATLNLTILNETTSTTNISVCAATLPYTWNGTPYNTAGSYVYHTLNAAGCDSAATLNLTILNETTSITNISVCAATLPYTWNGTPYNTAGSYVYHTLNAAGCDSAATLNLTILNETTSITNISVCAATLPYTWNGTPYNTAGSYVYHTLNAVGCDSAATLNLTILNETTSTTNISVCAATLPYTWNGTPYNTAGSYVYHTLNAAGCDSAATLNLTILNETTNTTNISICAATLPYTWNGTPYNTAGSYVYHTLNAAGCDSAATLNLTILNETTSITNISVCAATLPYTWNGTPYNTAGSYVYHTLNAAGCDSVATLNLTVNNAVTSNTDVTICPPQLPYSWNGNQYSFAGTYSVTLTTTIGCDSVATLNLTVNPEVTSTTNISVCPAQLPYTWNGQTYPAAGSYNVTLTNIAGCDSIATLNLVVNPEVTSTTNVSVCATTLPYTWNGTPYNTAGSYLYHTLNAVGCDSAATLNLTILNETTSVTNISVCAATLPYTWNGTPYNTAGSYVYHTLNAAGCDSAATLNLTILNETTSTTNISVCAATLPYTWNGSPYNTAGSYVYHTLNAAGCDSAATLNLTILNETASTTNVSVCATTLPYTWNGMPYNTAGNYVYHTLNTAGCDSAATLNLTILNETTSTTNISVCSATLPYTWNGTPYNTAGSYIYHTLNTAGCDSAATLNLTILNETTSVTNISVCAATLPYTWNGTPYNAAGSYVYHTLNAAGCDSAATLNLTILNETTSTTNVNVCAATLPYTWNGTPYNTAGSYVYHTLNAAGCDSAVTLNLTINPEATSTTNLTICPPQLPYNWNGNQYSFAGTYSVTLITTAGCDSVATLNLTVNPEVTSTTDISVCPAQLPYAWNGNIYNAAGSYNVTLINMAGCDSIATLNLIVSPEVTSSTNISACAATLPYTWNGTPYNTAGSYVYHTLNTAGCDSAATLNLTILNETISITDISVCSAALPYTWNGTPYNTAGSYVYHTLNIAGCDSAATLNLIVNNAVTSSNDVTICNAQLPYIWNGNTYNTAGSYNVTLVSTAGCDSIATLNLTVNNAVTSNTNVTICNAQLPYTWNGNTYNTAGSYNVTLVSTAGCDSIATLNLTVNNAVTSNTDVTICNAQLPYTWNGNTYNTAGLYSITLVSAAGCDSVATLNLTVNNAVTSNTDVTICNAQLPYTWNGNTYNTAGSYNVTLTSVAGCDSIATLNLTVNNAVTSNTDVTICNAQLPYTWNGNIYNTAGSYNVTLVSTAGCDSIATLNLTVNNAVTSNTDVTICNAQLPYTWNGNTYNTAGSYNVTLINTGGCDSIATLNLTVNNAVTSNTNVTICNAQLPYTWNGNTYNTAGSYNVTLVSTAGCDSIATLNLTVNNAVTSNTDVIICNAQLPYTWNGNIYNIAGSYNITLVSAAGCDSVATLNLTVNNAVTSNTDVTMCNAQLPYTWNGNTYNTAGLYSITLVSAAGCDSIATLNLTVNNAVTSNTDITICNVQLPYIWNGNTYNTAGSYNVTLISTAGCDSIATLNLTVNNAVTSNTNVTICNAQLPYTWNGNTYNTAGLYSITLVSAAGCDSIATLNLTVNNAVTSNTNVTICNAQLPYTWNGNTYNTAGSYNVTLVSTAGCDSIATLNLTVNNAVTSNTDVIICNAQLPYTWNGNTYNTAGLYSITLVSAAGCDSVATLNLTVNNAVTSNTDVTICNAQLPYTWNGNTYNTAGSYNVTLVSTAGCDSIATLNLTVNNAVASNTDVTICNAQLPYTWNGNTYNAAGSYSVTLVSTEGCDSIATLNLTVNNAVASNTDVTICNAQLPYTWNGNTYNAAGSYSVTLVSTEGCDSIATLNLTVNNAVTSNTDVTICNAQLPYTWNGNTYNTAGSYNVTLTSAAGCDSIATLNLTVNNAVTSNTNVTICNAQLPYAWNGNTYNTAGSYNVTLVSTAGCDSIATLNLTVNNAVASNTDVTICNAQLPYTWNGNTYNAAGSYSVTLVSTEGCDSIATLNLTVNNAVASNTDVTICNAQLPYIWNGNTYNTAGSYNVTLISTAGCDSIATLNLTVNNAVTSNTNVTICNAQLPYTWNGNTYNTAGSYNVTLVSTAGCDSIATLNLTVNNAVTSNTDVTICNAQLPYTWNGNIYNTAGSYNVTLTSAAGCDSVATLNLTVNNAVTSNTEINICPVQLPYVWNGNSYNTAGSYTVTLSSAAGCDSLATLDLIVSPTVTSTADITICNAHLPYVWNGNSYNTPGSYVATLINIAGCDSIATLNLIINNETTSITNINVCAGTLPYTWNGTPYNTAGNYVYHTLNAAGCDSAATLKLTVLNETTSTTNISVCAATLPYTWNGTPYNTTGSYAYHTLNAAGCDSTAILNLVINKEDTTITNVNICPPQLPYTWNGNVYNAAGTYTVILTNATGCDSLTILNLLVNPVVTSVTDVSICTTQSPYTWNGNVYNTTGTYTAMLTNIAGCDSVATLNLTVNNAVTSNTDVTICNAQLPYTWNGNTYNAAGSYNAILTSAAGCDSIATLNLTVNNAVTSNTDVTICNAQLPYTWNGNTYNTAGSYNVTLTSAAGCDSIATLNLTVNNAVTSNTDVTICNAQLPYTWNGNTYNAAGSYNATLTSAAGCDSIATLNLTVNNAVTSNTDVTICNAQLPYTWNGNTYNTAGSYNVTLTSAAGCDSIATLNLTVNNAVTSNTDVTICNAQLPYTWNGNTYNAAGSYNVTLTSAAGCDSIATLNLTVNNAVTGNTDVTICNAQLPYTWNGNTYNTAGSYNVTLVSSFGCDSVATLNLIVNNAVTSNTDVTICNAQLPYTWNGNTYNTAGSYNVTLTSAAGCDSIATLDLTVNNAVTSNTNVTICNAQLPYTWNGNTYNAAGSYNVTLVSTAGCDSIATLNLTVNNAVTSNTDVTICNTQLPYTWNGNTYNTAGSYNVTLIGTAGCDSVATLNLTVNNALTSNTEINICPVQLPYAWNGNTYNAAGSYMVTLISSTGCDSLATLNLSVSPIVTGITNITVCNAQLPYTWNGNIYNTAGTYTKNLTNIAGCDSVATLNLTVNNTVTSNTDITICNTQLPYTWNGNTYNAAGMYNVTLVSAAGCDSIATLNLTVNNAVTSNTDVTICNTQLPYTWNGNTYNAAGLYNITLVSAAGCDSVATLNLIVNNAVTSNTDITICNTQLPYTWNGNTYNAAGIYNVTLVSAAGCDSVATLNLTVNNTVTSNTNITICNAQLPYTWNGNTYNAAGSYNVTFTSISGCDSVAILNLTTLNESSSITSTRICAAALPYIWNGNSYNAAGLYIYHTNNAAGCDSAATLILTISNANSSVSNISVCKNNLPYTWNGSSYNESGTYNYHTINAAGCDSTVTLNLTVNNIVTSTTYTTICNTQLPYGWNGQPYTESGEYKATLTSAAGCDSVATLILTILSSGSSTVSNISICKNSLPYIWNGSSYNEGGTYFYHTTNAAGCDSTVTLNLTVNNTVTSTTYTSICNAQLPYSWNGQLYTAAGEYTVTLSSSGGCDSVAVLILTTVSTVTHSTTLTGCNSVSYNGIIYTSPRVVYETIKGSGGCDSVYIVTTINITNETFDLTLKAAPDPVNFGQPVKIMTSSDKPYSVLSWEPTNVFTSQNLLSQEIIADTTEHILVTARSSNGCIAKTALKLNINKPSDFWMPNAFTPNDDGNNDYFSAYGTGIKEGLLRIYNQWGQLLFETTNIKKGWDGKYKGVPQPVGVYAYVVFAEMFNGSKVTDKGFLNLIR